MARPMVAAPAPREAAAALPNARPQRADAAEARGVSAPRRLRRGGRGGGLLLTTGAAAALVALASWAGPAAAPRDIAARSLSAAFAVWRPVPRAAADATGEVVPAAAGAVQRRREAAAGVLAAWGAVPLAATATTIKEMPTELSDVAQAGAAAARIGVGKVPGRLKSVIVNVGDKEALQNEIKFFTEALQMEVLSQGTAKDGSENAVVGYAKDGGFGIEVRLDPELKNRPEPRLLNYEVMQPFVDTLCFVQVSTKGKSVEAFRRIQAAGGATLMGDAAYVDAESPRGVPLRVVIRKDAEPSVETVALNQEVTAFIALAEFYPRAFGIKEEKYPVDDPPVQQFSVYFRNPAGGPALLLSPVPDGRMTNRTLDEFEGLRLVSTDVAEVVKQTETVTAEILEAKRKRDEEEEERIKTLIAQGLKPKRKAKVTEAVPFVKRNGAEASAGAVANDGVGTILLIDPSS